MCIRDSSWRHREGAVNTVNNRRLPCALRSFMLLAMNLRKDLVQGIGRFLDSSPLKTIKRGRGCFARGDVLEIECVEPDQRYAAVVRGGQKKKASGSSLNIQ